MEKCTENIAKLNDEFRKSLLSQPTGILILTDGIKKEFAQNKHKEIIRKVREFSDFNDANDAYGERDFGSFMYGKERILWKIDYYDLSMEGQSVDPTDPAKTNRVLTLMLANDF